MWIELSKINISTKTPEQQNAYLYNNLCMCVQTNKKQLQCLGNNY